jgi:V8-like Glu-specific endopeptidase
MQKTAFSALGSLFFLGLIGLVAIGCASPIDDDGAGAATSEIVNGKTASHYAEAALINTNTFLCSGSVIAPRVVLTAGHCVHGATEWQVTTPFANGQKAVASTAWTEYVMHGEQVNPDTIDVGILILDTPIQLRSYPTLASAPVAEGTKAVNVGRIRNGQPSDTSLYYGHQVTLADGGRSGFKFDYVSSEVIESGDSGGPVYVTKSGVREIVAVNSGAGGGTEILARIDLVKQKIDEIIAQTGAQ